MALQFATLLLPQRCYYCRNVVVVAVLLRLLS
jgi:hypothetical protein